MQPPQVIPYAYPPPSLYGTIPPGWGQAPPAPAVAALLVPGPPAGNGGGESDIQSLCRLASQLVTQTGSVPQQLLDRIASVQPSTGTFSPPTPIPHIPSCSSRVPSPSRVHMYVEGGSRSHGDHRGGRRDGGRRDDDRRDGFR